MQDEYYNRYVEYTQAERVLSEARSEKKRLIKAQAWRQDEDLRNRINSRIDLLKQDVNSRRGHFMAAFRMYKTNEHPTELRKASGYTAQWYKNQFVNSFLPHNLEQHMSTSNYQTNESVTEILNSAGIELSEEDLASLENTAAQEYGSGAVDLGSMIGKFMVLDKGLSILKVPQAIAALRTPRLIQINNPRKLVSAYKSGTQTFTGKQLIAAGHGAPTSGLVNPVLMRKVLQTGGINPAATYMLAPNKAGNTLATLSTIILEGQKFNMVGGTVTEGSVFAAAQQILPSLKYINNPGVKRIVNQVYKGGVGFGFASEASGLVSALENSHFDFSTEGGKRLSFEMDKLYGNPDEITKRVLTSISHGMLLQGPKMAKDLRHGAYWKSPSKLRHAAKQIKEKDPLYAEDLNNMADAVEAYRKKNDIDSKELVIGKDGDVTREEIVDFAIAELRAKNLPLTKENIHREVSDAIYMYQVKKVIEKGLEGKEESTKKEVEVEVERREKEEKEVVERIKQKAEETTGKEEKVEEVKETETTPEINRLESLEKTLNKEQKDTVALMREKGKSEEMINTYIRNKAKENGQGNKLSEQYKAEDIIANPEKHSEAVVVNAYRRLKGKGGAIDSGGAEAATKVLLKEIKKDIADGLSINSPSYTTGNKRGVREAYEMMLESRIGFNKKVAEKQLESKAEVKPEAKAEPKTQKEMIDADYEALKKAEPKVKDAKSVQHTFGDKSPKKGRTFEWRQEDGSIHELNPDGTYTKITNKKERDSIQRAMNKSTVTGPKMKAAQKEKVTVKEEKVAEEKFEETTKEREEWTKLKAKDKLTPKEQVRLEGLEVAMGTRDRVTTEVPVKETKQTPKAKLQETIDFVKGEKSEKQFNNELTKAQKELEMLKAESPDIFEKVERRGQLAEWIVDNSKAFKGKGSTLKNIDRQTAIDGIREIINEKQVYNREKFRGDVAKKYPSLSKKAVDVTMELYDSIAREWAKNQKDRTIDDFYRENIGGIKSEKDLSAKERKRIEKIRKEGREPEGAHKVIDGKSFIIAFEKGGVKAVAHEASHIAERFLSPEQRLYIQEWSGQKEYNEKTSELLAKAWERYLGSGKAPTTRLKNIFSYFKNIFGKIYESLKKKVYYVDPLHGVRYEAPIDPKIERIFDKWLGVDKTESKRNVKYKPTEKRKQIGGAFETTYAVEQNGKPVGEIVKVERVKLSRGKESFETLTWKAFNKTFKTRDAATNKIIDNKIKNEKTGDSLIGKKKGKDKVKSIKDAINNLEKQSIILNGIIEKVESKKDRESLKKLYLDKVKEVNSKANDILKDVPGKMEWKMKDNPENLAEPFVSVTDPNTGAKGEGKNRIDAAKDLKKKINDINKILESEGISYKESHQTLLFRIGEKSDNTKEWELDKIDDVKKLATIYSRKNTAEQFIKTMRGAGVNKFMSSDKSLKKFFEDTKTTLEAADAGLPVDSYIKQKKSTVLKGKIRALRQGIKKGEQIKKNQIKEAADEIRALAKEILPKEMTKGEVEQILTRIAQKDLKAKDVLDAATRFVKIAEAHEVKDLNSKNKSLLKKTMPKKDKSGVTKGAFKEVKWNETFDKIRKVVDMDKVMYKDKIVPFKEMAREIIDLANSKGKDFNSIITITSSKGKTLEMSINDLIDVAKFGGMKKEKNINEARGNNAALEALYEMANKNSKTLSEIREAEMKQMRGDVLKTVTGNGKAKRRKFKSLTFLERQMIKGFDGFGDIMERLSKNDKSLKMYEGPLYEFHNRTARATVNTDFDILRHEADLMQKQKEIYGTKSKGEHQKLLKEFMQENHKLEWTQKDGIEREMFVSQNQLYKVWQWMQDPTLKSTFENMGWGKEHFDMVEKTLDPRAREWAEWQLNEFYPRMHDYINPTHIERTGLNAAKIDGYSPVAREGKEEGISDVADVFSNTYSTTSTWASSQRSRTNTITPFDLARADGDAMLLGHVKQAAHFVNWSSPIRDMRSVFNNPSIKTAIREYHGKDMTKLIDDRINSMAAGQYIKHKTYRFLDVIRANSVYAKIGMNPVVFIKQLTSFPAYASDIGVKDFTKGFTDFFNPFTDAKGNMSGAKFAEKFKFLVNNSKMMQVRYKIGHDRDVADVLRKNDVDKLTGSKNWADTLLWLTKQGDKSAIVMGGWGVYKKYYDQAIKKGKSEADAVKFGIDKFERATERAQQSYGLTHYSELQMSGSLGKVLTMFKTSPIQYNRMERNALRNLINRKGDTMKNLKSFTIAHFILPGLFQYISDGLPGLASDWTEDKKAHMKRTALLGSYGTMFSIMDLLSNQVDLLFGAENKPWTDEYSASPITSDLPKVFVKNPKKAIAQMQKWIDGEDVEFSEVMDVLKIFGESITVAAGQKLGAGVLLTSPKLMQVIKDYGNMVTGETEFIPLKAVGFTDYALGLNPDMIVFDKSLEQKMSPREFEKSYKEKYDKKPSSSHLKKYKAYLAIENGLFNDYPFITQRTIDEISKQRTNEDKAKYLVKLYDKYGSRADGAIKLLRRSSNGGIVSSKTYYQYKKLKE